MVFENPHVTWVTSWPGFGSRQAGMQAPTKLMVPAGSIIGSPKIASFSNMAEAAVRFPARRLDFNMSGHDCQAENRVVPSMAAGFEKVPNR